MTTRSRRPTAAAPFFRWIGGKRRLIASITPLLPTSFATYHEPFLGSGALFLHLASTGQLTHRAYLADANPDLVNAFRCIRDDPEGVIDRLLPLTKAHSREVFYAIRAQDRDVDYALRPANERAARFVYLANASFNGGWRVDRAGRVISAPSSGSPRLINVNAIRQAARFLGSTSIECLDFRSSLTDTRIGSNDLVFLDPPHLPRGATEDPTRYTLKRFTHSDQNDLEDLVRQLAERDVRIVLSLAWDEQIAHRFQGFNIIRVDRPRVAVEALVTNTPIMPQIALKSADEQSETLAVSSPG